ncbi:glycosyltransferase [Flavobacterium sp.]|uniref:glycosyltransferase n=1 Tax=Flavobacterium sp. TaxID=239 RepID=UPI00262E9DA7|nr:glycosyltransferase [Flavobacterium sp.]
MKILIVDDQELVLISLEKCLTDLGYEVMTSNSVNDAKEKYDSYMPNLVIADINMPEYTGEVVLNNHEYSINTSSGLDVVHYIKVEKNHDIPVMILSGNNNEDVIEKGFALGATDYMKKPLSLNEIGIRVKRLIGASNISYSVNKNKFIQNKVIGVVIPCYNEEKRLMSEEFKKFVNSNLSYHLCFVNDGSKDNTLDVLYDLKKQNEGRISVYNCEQNGGKAEAVRLGMLHLAKQQQFDYIGFLDADLSTNFEDFDALVDTIKDSNFKIVSGSRITRMGADIEKESARAIISKTINFIIRKTLGMDFKDTQCGAKIMTKDVVEDTFQTKFLTKWLFDVEIFMRMRQKYGLETAKTLLCEKPLDRWVHMDGSKLSFKDSFKILGQIGQIALHYK